MKLSTQTIQLLKHFSTLNPIFRIEPGSELQIVSDLGDMVAFAIVDEKFDKKFLTTDLSKFLSVSSLVDDAEYEFSENHVEIIAADGSHSTNFYYATEALVPECRQRPEKQPVISFEFTMTDEVIQKIFKASSTLSVPDIVFTTKDDMLIATVTDAKTKSSNAFAIEVGQFKRDEGATLETFTLQKSSLRLLLGLDYTFSVADSGLITIEAMASPFERLTFYLAIKVAKN